MLTAWPTLTYCHLSFKTFWFVTISQNFKSRNIHENRWAERGLLFRGSFKGFEAKFLSGFGATVSNNSFAGTPTLYLRSGTSWTSRKFYAGAYFNVNNAGEMVEPPLSTSSEEKSLNCQGFFEICRFAVEYNFGISSTSRVHFKLEFFTSWRMRPKSPNLQNFLTQASRWCVHSRCTTNARHEGLRRVTILGSGLLKSSL